MARRKFSSPLRISVTANNRSLVTFICLIFLLVVQLADTKRIDEGGIVVSTRYEPNIIRSSSSLTSSSDEFDGDGGGGGGGGGGLSSSHEIPSSPSSSSQDQRTPLRLPGRVIALRNRPLTLECPIKVTQNQQRNLVWWLKDGVRLPVNQSPTLSSSSSSGYHHFPSSERASSSSSSSSGRIKLIGNDLHFEKVVHKVSISNSTGGLSGSSHAGAGGRERNYSDEGNYRCVLKTPGGVALSPIIRVDVAVLEVQEPVGITKEVGEWIVLECPIRSIPSGTVTWFRENENISEEVPNGRYRILHTGSLLIKQVQLSDSGTFRCAARNELLRRERRSEVNLTVVEGLPTTGDGSLLSSPYYLNTFPTASHILLEEDENLMLDCIAYGVPLPSITWVFTFLYENDTASVPVSTILSDGKVGQDTIYLTPRNSSLSANYTCVVANGVGPPLTKTVQVSRQPVLLKAPESQQFPPAKTVRFECRVRSPFYLVWYKDGQLLEAGKGRVKTRGNELVLSNTIRNDSGFYQCEVLADGKVYAVGTARLLVESGREQPDAPVELQCKAESSRMISVSWRGPSRTDVKAYTVHYTAAGGEERQQVTKNTTFLIDTLKPHTNYSIYVRSYSGFSASAQSQRVYCITKEDVPIGVPRPLTFERFGPHTQVRVRWRPLSNSVTRGRILWYKIQWRTTHGSFNNVRYLDGGSDEFLITDLKEGQSYEMRIIPATSVGYPVDKDSVPWIVVPSEGMSGSSPFDSVEIEFGSPTISSGLPSSSSSHNQQHLGTELNSTNVFHPNNAAVDLEELFSPPSVHLTVINSTAVLVHWIEPPSRLRTNVTPKGFRLTYSTYHPRIDDLIHYGPIYILDYTIREYYFTNLEPVSLYEISVQTFGEAWESEVATKTARTLSSDPSDEEMDDDLTPIVGVKSLPLSSTEIRVTWDAPKLNDSEIVKYYTVKYNRVDSSESYYVRSVSESVDIKDLLPFTAYEFMVRYDLADQPGPYSQKVESRTLAGKPGPPAGVDWKVTSNRTIHLSWLAPLEPNGLIQQYWVEYKNKSDSQGFHTQSITYVSSGNRSDSSEFDTTGRIVDWNSASTNTTSMLLQNLTANQWYIVRVRAETGAGKGEATRPLSVRIFLNAKPTSPPPPHHHQPVNHEMQDEPSTSTGFFIPSNKQHLGVVLGSSLGLCCIIICATIIIFRNRCFPFFTRTSRHPTNYVNGNGSRWKHSLESVNGMELKQLQCLTVNETQTETKGGHQNTNGLISGPNQDGVSDPLLMRIVRNPIEQREQELDLDIQIRNGCIR